MGYVASGAFRGVTDLAGNLPIAVTQTVAKDAPFDPSRDVELGVAYISYVIIKTFVKY